MMGMNEVARWQGSAVEVQARLVPRFLWNTASIDVFLDGKCILRTGGKLNLTGSYSATFDHSGSTHKAELTWGFSGLSFSFPYRLQIDGVPVVASRVQVENWWTGLAVGILFGLVMAVIAVVAAYFAASHIIPSPQN